MSKSVRMVALACCLTLGACGPSTIDETSNPSADLNDTAVIEPVSSATAEQTLAFLKQGDAHACSTQAVKDTLTSMSFPEQPDNLRASDWQEYTSKVTVDLSMITLSGINKDSSSVECNAHATVEGGLPREIDVSYTVSPDLNDDTNYVVRAGIGPLQQSVNHAVTNAIRPLLEQIARDEAEESRVQAEEVDSDNLTSSDAVLNM